MPPLETWLMIIGASLLGGLIGYWLADKFPPGD